MAEKVKELSSQLNVNYHEPSSEIQKKLAALEDKLIQDTRQEAIQVLEAIKVNK